jgi:hypothetical protein
VVDEQETSSGPGSAVVKPLILGSSTSFVVLGGQFGCASFAGVEECWGNDSTGATSVNGLTGVTAMAAGEHQVCAVVAGAVQCWGGGVFTTPQAVSGLPTDITLIGGGGNFFCAVSTSQGVLCWGKGLFDNDNEVSVTSMRITSSSVTQLVTAHNNVCVLKSGVPICWGLDTSATYNPPATPSGINTAITVSQIALGSYYICVIQLGAVHCSGSFDGLDQQGNGSIVLGASGITSGGEYTCATDLLGLFCWGGEVEAVASAVPHNVGVSGTVTSVSIWGDHACAIAGGTIQCWGSLAAPSPASW